MTPSFFISPLSTIHSPLFQWPLAPFLQHLAVYLQGLVDGRHSGVGGDLENDLRDLPGIAPHVQCRVDMELELPPLFCHGL
jgi:hypothetical protein